MSYKKHSVKRIKKVQDYTKSNPEKHKEWAKKGRQKRKNKFFEFKSKLFCTNCGENHIGCLDFHHLNPKEKERTINKLWACPNLLEKELKKCIVLCANCHRKLHWEEKENLTIKNNEKDV